MRSGPILCTFSCHCMLCHKISTVALRKVHIHCTTWILTFYLDHYSCDAYLALYSELRSYCLNYMCWCVMLPEDQKMILNTELISCLDLCLHITGWEDSIGPELMFRKGFQLIWSGKASQTCSSQQRCVRFCSDKSSRQWSNVRKLVEHGNSVLRWLLRLFVDCWSLLCIRILEAYVDGTRNM